MEMDDSRVDTTRGKRVEGCGGKEKGRCGRSHDKNACATIAAVWAGLHPQHLALRKSKQHHTC